MTDKYNKRKVQSDWRDGPYGRGAPRQQLCSAAGCPRPAMSEEATGRRLRDLANKRLRGRETERPGDEVTWRMSQVTVWNIVVLQEFARGRIPASRAALRKNSFGLRVAGFGYTCEKLVEEKCRTVIEMSSHPPWGRMQGHRAQGTPACRQAGGTAQRARSRNEIRYLWLPGREPTRFKDRFRPEWEWYGREQRAKRREGCEWLRDFAALRLCGEINLLVSTAAQPNICRNGRNATPGF
jgi:hypothetical protein